MRLEHQVLLRGRQPGIKRQNFDLVRTLGCEPRGTEMLPQRIGSVINLSLPRKEHQNIARAGLNQLGSRLADASKLINTLALVVNQRLVADLNRLGAAGNFQHRYRGAQRLLVVFRKAGRINSGRSNNQL